MDGRTNGRTETNYRKDFKMVKNENKIISNVQVVEENIQIITPSTIKGNFYPYIKVTGCLIAEPI